MKEAIVGIALGGLLVLIGYLQNIVSELRRIRKQMEKHKND